MVDASHRARPDEAGARLARSPGLLGGLQGGQFLGGKLLEEAPLLLEPSLEPEGNLVQLGRVDPPGQLGQLQRIQVAKPLPLSVELQFHPQDGLAELGMSLGGAAHHQGLVAPGQPMMVIMGVQAKADQGGSDAARFGERLLRHDHLGVGLSRGVAERTGMSSQSVFRTAQGSACPALLIGFPPTRK